jgi:hypothetical protein
VGFLSDALFGEDLPYGYETAYAQEFVVALFSVLSVSHSLSGE